VSSKKQRKKVAIKQSEWVDVEPVYVPTYVKSQMVGSTYKQQPAGVMVGEDNGSDIIFTFGRFNPPTIGHELLVDSIKDHAQRTNAIPLVISSKTHDGNKNPIPNDKKLQYIQKAFGSEIVHPQLVDNMVDAFKVVGAHKPHKATIVVGADREKDTQRLINNNNGKEFHIPEINILVAGPRNLEYNDVSGASGSKARAYARDHNIEGLRAMLHSNLHDEADAVMNDINNTEDGNK
jgi:hypothetical protein